MNESTFPEIDPSLDLVLERVVDVPVELLWKAWTTPAQLVNWFCPQPWSVSDCEIDLRPGGVFKTTMRSPDGTAFPNVGCYLEVVPNERLVFTDALLPGYRPSPKPFFTAVILLKREGVSTRYTAIAMHRDEETKKQHEAMGFSQGWNTVLDQLVAYIKSQ